MIRRALAPFALLAAPCVVAQAPGAPGYVEPEKQLARLVRVVPPDFPKAALEQRTQGVVQVEGVVQANGQLENVAYRPETDSASIFVAALADVLPMWSFEPALAPSCQPSKRPVTVRVHFEIESDKPRIFVTHTKDRFPSDYADSSAGEKRDLSAYKALSRPSPTYPRSMIFAGIESNVYLKIKVAPSGDVEDVDAKAFLMVPYIPKETRDAIPRIERRIEEMGETSLAPFELESRKALLRWRYPPTEGPNPRLMCYSVHFRLKN